MKINLCIPTLNRYDLLIEELKTADFGELPPDHIYIFDNGGQLRTDNPRVTVINTPTNLGVAKAWNWFILNVSEARIIANDDLEFGPLTIKNMVEALENGAEFVGLNNITGLNLFSLFTISDSCVEKVGLFDEGISPNYAYFEDNDYHRRMELLGIPTTYVAGDVIHKSSSTMAVYTEEQLKLHHEKFRRAKANYILKWKGEPGKETITDAQEYSNFFSNKDLWKGRKNI